MILNDFVKHLKKLGLSTVEAKAYITLLQSSPLTGYQVAKRSEAARGSIYDTLKRLEAKGAARRTLEGDYVPVPLQDFLYQQMDHFRVSVDFLKNHKEEIGPGEQGETVLNFQEYGEILRTARKMLEGAKTHVYLGCFHSSAIQLELSLKKALEHGARLVILSYDRMPDLTVEVKIEVSPLGDQIHEEIGGEGIALVVDGREALLGQFDLHGHNNAVWTNNPWFVRAVVQALKHHLFIERVVMALPNETLDQLRKVMGDSDSQAILASAMMVRAQA